VRECCNCKTRLLKVEDCNNMTCPKCKCKMCYICGATVSSYSHFYGQSARAIDGKCPLYNDTNSLHVTESSTCTPPKKKFCGQKAEDSDPKHPAEPVVPKEPMVPKEPVEHMVPKEPVELIESVAVEPVEPEEPEEPEKPVEPEEPEKPKEPEEPAVEPIEHMKHPRKKTRRICCVVGCHNYHGRDEVKVFAFPNKNPSQKEKWIKAVNRVNNDKTPWMPTKSSFVCSDHFVDKKYSTIENHPDYVPSIFPTSHVVPKSVSDVLRHKRVSLSVYKHKISILILRKNAKLD
jgi:hypothetical protein